MRKLMKAKVLLQWLLAVGAACLVAGCVSNPLQSKRLTRYRPDVDKRSPWLWQDQAGGRTEPAAGVPTTQGRGPRRLHPGEEVVIHLRGIPYPAEVPVRISDQGQVNLDFIGNVSIGGLTTAEAQKLIEKAYVDGGFYSEINVIVRTEDEEYFVRGEVKAPGRYLLAGDKTLLAAIAQAGGYTKFAKTSQIRITRGDALLEFDARDIEKQRVPDPLIKPRDIIVVPPRRFL